MDNHEVEDKFNEFEAKILEQEHRLFPVWYNFFTKKKYSSNDKRRNAINKALIWSLIPKPTPTIIAISALSILTIFLAYEANLKLENQNTLLLVQNELQESQRRASLNIEISSIMQQINSEREASRLTSLKDDKHKRKGHKVSPYVLSDITAARIASISRSLRPYRILKTDRVDLNLYSITDFWDRNNKINITKKLKTNDFLEEHIRSPEREQLLTALSTMRISFSNIGKNSNFDFSKFKDFDFSNGDLRTIRMSNSTLDTCNLSYTIFDEGILKNTIFTAIYGTSLSFISTDLEGSDFSNASINNTSFEEANLTGVNFDGANLIQCNFDNATLEGADFSYANLSGIDFENINDFTNVKSLNNTLMYNMQNCPDSIMDFAISKGALTDWNNYQNAIKNK